MVVTGLNHITLATSDLARSVGFYRDLLGATLRAHWASGAYLELGDIWLCLMQTAGDIPFRTDYTHLAFSCEAAEFAPCPIASRRRPRCGRRTGRKARRSISSTRMGIGWSGIWGISKPVWPITGRTRKRA
ncbi:Glyoxalase/Bleomycin resistance protein/Dioxygenase superfamily protein [Aliiroseovarius crassostreae]|nr:Glyoxalase/Bleomycin resistance protein/Dioxygenase superfamily protein [Aliiroseovarius crassostreae]